MSLANRQDFPSLAEIVHFNTGGMGPMPRSVCDELVRLPQYVGAHGPGLLFTHDEGLTRTEWAHRMVADLLGVMPDEVAFTSQFSGAVNIVTEGLPWQAGDEIIVSDQEHPAMLTPILNVARRHGVVVRRFPVGHDRAAMLSAYRALLGPRTRLVAVSHVTTENGIRLPVQEITELAHQQGALVLIDGAQSVGQIPVDLRTLPCDFYAIVGYKWLLGPYPSAALIIRRNVLDRVEVTWTGSRVTETSGIDMDEVVFKPGAQRFEYGGRVFCYDSAMATGAEYVARLGVEAIEEQSQRLASYGHAAFGKVPGARIHSPLDPSDSTGILTFSVDGLPGTTISPALRDRFNILTRPALNGTSVRASLALYINEADIDYLVESVRAIAAG